MPTRRVTIVDGEVRVLPCGDDLERLALSPYKRFYVAYDPKDKGLYKLHKVYVDIDSSGLRPNYKRGYVWLAIWNSDVYSLWPLQEPPITIEAAIRYAFNKGWSVRQLNQDNFFKYLIEDMNNDPSILHTE